MEYIIASIIIIASFLLLFLNNYIQKRRSKKKFIEVSTITRRSTYGSPRRAK